MATPSRDWHSFNAAWNKKGHDDPHDRAAYVVGCTAFGAASTPILWAVFLIYRFNDFDAFIEHVIYRTSFRTEILTAGLLGAVTYIAAAMLSRKDTARPAIWFAVAGGTAAASIYPARLIEVWGLTAAFQFSAFDQIDWQSFPELFSAGACVGGLFGWVLCRRSSRPSASRFRLNPRPFFHTLARAWPGALIALCVAHVFVWVELDPSMVLEVVLFPDYWVRVPAMMAYGLLAYAAISRLASIRLASRWASVIAGGFTAAAAMPALNAYSLGVTYFITEMPGFGPYWLFSAAMFPLGAAIAGLPQLRSVRLPRSTSQPHEAPPARTEPSPVAEEITVPPSGGSVINKTTVFLTLTVAAIGLLLFWLFARQGHFDVGIGVLLAAAVAALVVQFVTSHPSGGGSEPLTSGRIALIRLGLGIASLVGLLYSLPPIATSVEVAYHVSRGEFEVPDEDEAFRDTIVGSLVEAAKAQDYDAEVRRAIADDDIVRAEALITLADNTSFIELSSSTRAAYNDATSFMNSLWRGAGNCLSGGLLRNATNLTEIACMLGLDTTIPWLGDGIDITQQSLAGDERDDLILAIASLSLAIQTYSYLSEHDTSTLHTGIKTLGVAARSARGLKAAPKLQKELTDKLLTAGKLAGSSGGGKQAMASVQPILDSTVSMSKHGSWSTPIAAMKHADDLSDLAFYERVTRIFGRNADGLMAFMGKGLKAAFISQVKTALKFRHVPGEWFALLTASVLAATVALSGSVAKLFFMGFLKRRQRALS